MSTPTCDCVPLPRIFGYDDSQPVIPYGDLRTSIGDREYYGDQTISDFELPVCKTIGDEAFRDSSLTGINTPVCETIGDYAFYETRNWSNGIRCDFSNVKTIGENAFRNADVVSTGTIEINIQNVETIKRSAFYQATGFWFYPRSSGSVNELILPKCRVIEAGAFSAFYDSDAKSIHRIELPSIITIGGQAFRRIKFGATADDHGVVKLGPNCTELGSEQLTIFYDDMDIGTNGSYLDLYIEATTPPRSLGLNYTEINIFVPAQSVEAYKAHADWSRYASYINPIPT